MPNARRFMWLAGLAGAAILAVGVFYRVNRLSTLAPPVRSPAPAAVQLTDAQVEQVLINLRSTMFSTAPLSSAPLVQSPPEPVLSENFRNLIALPPEAPVDAPQIDPRRLRAVMDRGVVTFGSAANDVQRQEGAELIQTAALLGFLPARNLLVRNYPQSEPVRRTVPAPDVIRYAAAIFLSTGTISKDSQAVFQTLAVHFAATGQNEQFLVQLLESLRGDKRPQLSYRIDTLFELLAGVRGACGTLARIVSAGTEPAASECSSHAEAQALRRLIETSKPVDRENDSKRRGFALLNKLGAREAR